MEIGVSKSGWDILYKSERLGHHGWCNQPRRGEVHALQEFFRTVNPNLVIELGTRFGGTALAIHDAIPDARLFSFDFKNSSEDQDIVISTVPKEDDKIFGEYSKHLVCRHWFPPHVRFIRLNFLREKEGLIALVDRQPEDEKMVMFVDGFKKLEETALYMDWLLPGDIMAVNNWQDEIGGAEPLDKLLTGYERFMWGWSEKNLVYTRMWLKC